MKADEVNYGKNAGGSCKHPANSGQVFACKGWHVISRWMEAEEVTYVSDNIVDNENDE
jgi:hypothetical protein